MLNKNIVVVNGRNNFKHYTLITFNIKYQISMEGKTQTSSPKASRAASTMYVFSFELVDLCPELLNLM